MQIPYKPCQESRHYKGNDIETSTEDFAGSAAAGFHVQAEKGTGAYDKSTADEYCFRDLQDNSKLKRNSLEKVSRF